MPSIHPAPDYPAINPERVPVNVECAVARKVIRKMRRYFAQPGVQERFEAWQRERGTTIEQEAAE